MAAFEVMINDKFKLRVNPAQPQGSFHDGVNNMLYGDNPVAFTHSYARAGRCVEATIRGVSVHEYAAALMLFGISLRTSLLRNLMVPWSKVPQDVGRLEKMRGQISNVADVTRLIQELAVPGTVHIPLKAPTTEWRQTPKKLKS